MGPLLYTWSVVDWNVVMQRVTVATRNHACNSKQNAKFYGIL